MSFICMLAFCHSKENTDSRVVFQHLETIIIQFTSRGIMITIRGQHTHLLERISRVTLPKWQYVIGTKCLDFDKYYSLLKGLQSPNVGCRYTVIDKYGQLHCKRTLWLLTSYFKFKFLLIKVFISMNLFKTSSRTYSKPVKPAVICGNLCLKMRHVEEVTEFRKSELC